MRPGRSEPYASEREQPFLIKDLRTLKFLLIQPQGDEGKALRSHLERIGCGVQEVWPPPPSYPEEIDIIFVMVDRVIESRLTFHWEAEDPSAVLIAVIGLPIRPFGILTNLLAAVNNHRREQRLRLNLERLQAKLEASRVVERAKLTLMLAGSHSEKEAYRLLRQLAMQRRTTVDVVSGEILSGLNWPSDEAIQREE